VGLGLGLLVTVISWLLMRRVEQTRLDALKTEHAKAVVLRMEQRMTSLSTVLRGAAGYLGRGDVPTRAEWRAYVTSLDLPATYPGLQGLSFVEWVPPEDLSAQVRRVRQEGFPDYVVRPGGPDGPLAEGAGVILYLEPVDVRNQRAFGRDMLAEVNRREAMLRARDTGQVFVSARLTLYQETEADAQPGIVLFAPVYRQGQPLESVLDRRRALRGWASIPLRLTDFMQATLPQEQRLADIEIYDGPGPDAEHLLFDSNPSAPHAEPAKHQLLPVAGRHWTTRVEPGPVFYQEIGRPHHWLALQVGGPVSLLVFLVLAALVRGTQQARTLAETRGEELLATEAQFRAFFERAPFGMAIVDSSSGRFLSVNPRLGDILGYSTEELLARDFQSITHPEHLQGDLASVRDLASGAMPVIHKEMRYLHRSGQEIWARLSMAKLPSVPGAPDRHLSVVEDIRERRRIEDALRRSEANLSLAQEIGEFGSWQVVYQDGNESWSVSDGLRRLYGYRPDQPITLQTGFEIMHPEDREAVRSAWEAAMAGTGPSEWEHRIIVDGEVRWVAVRVLFQFNQDGRLQEASGIVQDITRRRATEEALRLSEARLRILGDQLPDSFLYQFLSRPEEAPRFLYLSAGVERLCGLRAGEVVQDPGLLFSQVDPTMLPAYLQTEAVSARDLSPFAMDLRQRHVDGRWRWFRVRSKPRPQPDGSVLWEGISTDITETQEARLLLEQSEARFRGVVEQAADAIYIHDEGEQFVFANPEAIRTTGYSTNELLGMHVWDLDHETAKEVRMQAWQSMAPGQKGTAHTRMRRKDGSTFPVEFRFGLLQQEPRLFLTVVRDLTERERIMEADSRARKAESLVLMAGSIAHDFNNIFQGVLGFLEVAKLRAEQNPDVRQLLGRAEGSLRKAIGLSWKMLDFSGRALVRPERLDLEGWLPAFAATLQLDLPDTCHLDVSCEPLPYILGDRARLEEVLLALVANAREAADPLPGRVRLRLHTDFGADRPDPASPGIWPLSRPKLPATVCLEVSDEGPGVPAAILDRICDPFFTTHQLGRGLGLPSVMGILQAHHAGLHIFNGERGGLVVRMHFPPGGA